MVNRNGSDGHEMFTTFRANPRSYGCVAADRTLEEDVSAFYFRRPWRCCITHNDFLRRTLPGDKLQKPFHEEVAASSKNLRFYRGFRMTWEMPPARQSVNTHWLSVNRQLILKSYRVVGCERFYLPAETHTGYYYSFYIDAVDEVVR